MELQTANAKSISNTKVMGHLVTIEQALKYIEQFEWWAKEKAARNLPVGQPGLAVDCPICHYIQEVTGWQIHIGVDANHRGAWWLLLDIEHIVPLPPAFEEVRKRIDQHITISAKQLVSLLRGGEQ